ncbi:U32 family peptidase [Shewanella aestuarii]|uniref:Ubiquinone biosynthesis protein UbiV n=1 Tax=Shewanella aestuarii TaxID=1028752 RepID=A0A6G9QH05_9GAMM|nr:U32 family peptidase [Shewanella aestuarii]QIR13810.1 U32 family peptidase [Shewanella aestuarii]
MKYSLAPLTYCWDKASVFDYYQAMSETKIDCVYLGEVICSRRRELKFNDYLELAHMLKAKGKQVFLSSMTLIESQSEITELTRLVNNGEFAIEANDMAAVHLASQAKVPFVCGPAINLYNRSSIDLMHNLGMTRFVMPYELSQKWLENVLRDNKPTFETEVFGYGYMPLAHSARCFTAKHHQQPKLDCKIVCQQYPKGLLTQTQESQPLLRLNGIQTQSAARLNLIDQIPVMAQIGVDYWRLSPSSISDIELINQITASDLTQLASIPPENDTANECNGYWFSKPGMEIQ